MVGGLQAVACTWTFRARRTTMGAEVGSFAALRMTTAAAPRMEIAAAFRMTMAAALRMTAAAALRMTAAGR